MTTTAVVRAARDALGPAGPVLPVSFGPLPPVRRQRGAVRRLESAGYRAAWTKETVGDKDAFVQLAFLLAATERMVFGTSVANIWARAPQTAHAASAQLAEAYPGRFVLGLGGGYPEQAASVGREFGRPLATMRGYLERMDGETAPPAPAAAYPRVIGANGPKLVALAADIADGAMPAMQPAAFTAATRHRLGPGKLLLTGLRVSPDSDPGQVTAGVGEHRAAGADHVLLMLPIGSDFAGGIDLLERLAPALAGLA